jgi:hypothetical protein
LASQTKYWMETHRWGFTERVKAGMHTPQGGEADWPLWGSLRAAPVTREHQCLGSGEY